ncbi:hypothetical protein DJ523_01220, partial [Sulfolobus sp. E5]
CAVSSSKPKPCSIVSTPAVIVTDPIKEDVLNSVEYFRYVINKIAAKPIALVVNMVPESWEAKEEVENLINDISHDFSPDIILIPYKNEFLHYSKIKEESELSIVGKKLEKLLKS